MNKIENNINNSHPDTENEIILYQPDSTLSLDVRVENESVWLNRNQIALLFDRDVKISVSISTMRLKKNWIDFQLSQNLRQLHLMARLNRWNTII